MNIRQLHNYLEQLIEAGVDPALPVVVPGRDGEGPPEEISDAMLVDGLIFMDPSPKMSGFHPKTGKSLLFSSLIFDRDSLCGTYALSFPPLDPPDPEPRCS